MPKARTLRRLYKQIKCQTFKGENTTVAKPLKKFRNVVDDGSRL